MIFEHISTCENDTYKMGEIIGSLLEPGNIIALIGDLGAGKTVLVKGIAKGLNTEEEPNSPTFTIMSIYDGNIPLCHFDLYRISKIEELEDIGYKDFFFGDGISVVEWADKIEEILPVYSLKISISYYNDGFSDSEKIRKLIIEGSDKWILLFKSMVEQAFRT